MGPGVALFVGFRVVAVWLASSHVMRWWPVAALNNGFGQVLSFSTNLIQNADALPF
jgi:hypothetical protein